MKSIRFAALFVACTVAPGALAEGLAINPGMWETTVNMNNPFTGETTETKSECVEETEFDPADMMEDAEGCELVRSEVDGNQLDFAMECNMQGAQSSMSGVFETDGKTGSGNMDISVNASGMNMEMSMTWTSKRVGDC